MKISVNGGHTPSAQGAVGYLNEVECDRQVKDALINELRSRGHEVIDSTSPDNLGANDDLYHQVNTTNAAGVDLGISIHFNAGGGTGVECLYYPGSAAGSNYSVAISNRVSSALGLRDRGAKARDDLYWLRATSCVAVLVEVCFVDTQTDADAYWRVMAQAIADAISDATVGEEPKPQPTYEHIPSHDVQIFEQNATDAQRWWMRDNGDGTVSIRNVSSYQWLSLPNADTTNENRIQVWGGIGNENDDPKDERQKWILEPTEREGVYIIASAVDRNKVLDVRGLMTQSNTPVQIYDKTGKYNQQWYFYQLDDKSYRIINCGSFKLLDVVGGGV